MPRGVAHLGKAHKARKSSEVDGSELCMRVEFDSAEDALHLDLGERDT